MSTGTWEPAGPTTKKLDVEVLQALVALAQSIFDHESMDSSDDKALPEKLAASTLANSQWLMKLPSAEWDIAEANSSEELVALARFFTLVEVQVPGWSAGKDSPVIALVKILRQREAFEPALRKWIKTNTDNRYLPNGSAL